MIRRRGRDQRRRHRRATLAVFRDRLPLVLGGVVTFLLAAGVLLFSTGGFLRFGGGPRSVEDREALLASGECALRNGEPLGRIVGTLTPSRGLPRRRYHLQALDERRVLQVLVDEVDVVPCTSLAGAQEQGSAP